MNKEIQEKVKKYTLTGALIKFFKDDLESFISNPKKKFNISKLFKKSRIKRKKTIEEMAEIIGTSPLTIDEVEQCDCKTSLKELSITI